MLKFIRIVLGLLATVSLLYGCWLLYTSYTGGTLNFDTPFNGGRSIGMGLGILFDIIVMKCCFTEEPSTLEWIVISFYGFFLAAVIALVVYVREHPELGKTTSMLPHDWTAPTETAPASATTNAATPKPPAAFVAPTMISPNSTNYINPDHVHPVEQPAQPATNAPEGPAVQTNTPGTVPNPG